MGCACGKSGEVAMVGFKNPRAVFHASHVRVTTNNKKADIYLGALEQKLHIGNYYELNDYRQMLQDLREMFFQYLDNKTVLQDDRGIPVSAHYRKAMDWRLYERFEREFAAELYRRRDERMTRQELNDLFEIYIKNTHINLRPEHLQTDGHDYRREYIGQILIIPSGATNNNMQSENYKNNTNGRDDYNSSSSSESRNSKIKKSIHVKASKDISRHYSSSRSDSDSEIEDEDDKRKGDTRIELFCKANRLRSNLSSGSDSNSERELEFGQKQHDVKSESDHSTDNITEQVIDYESLLEVEFQNILDEGISANEYILLLLLYSQALEDLRNQKGQGEQNNIILNFKNNFLTKRTIIENKFEEKRQTHKEENTIPDTRGYTEAVEKELKENEEKIYKDRLIERNNESTETETSDSSQYEKQLQDFINKQTALIKKLEEERENEIKQLEETIAESTDDITSETSDSSEMENESIQNKLTQEEQQQIEKTIKKNRKKLEKAVKNDPSDKKNIKKKLKNIRKKLKQTVEEVDGKRLKTLETIEEENELNGDPLVDNIGHIENTESYGKMVGEELLTDEDLLMENIKRLRILRENDMEEFEREKKRFSDRLEQQSKRMLKLDNEREELLDKTDSDLIDYKLKEIERNCLENILEDVTDDERIKQILEKHRQGQINLAREVDGNRLRQHKRGKSADAENETNMLDLIRSTDDYSEDLDKELQNETDKLLEALKDIDSADSDGSEKRQKMLEEHLNELVDTFKRLDSDRNNIVTNIGRSTNTDGELVDNLNNEFVKAIEEDISSCDDEIARKKLQEHRNRQIKLLEDMDSDRIQRKSLLAQKLLQMKNKPAVEEKTQVLPVMETGEYLETLDKALQCNEDELMEFLNEDDEGANEEGRQKEISDRIEDYVDRQKQLVGRFESERREKILEATKEPKKDMHTNLDEINGWLKKSLSNGPILSESDVKDKLAEFRSKQKKLLEDIDSSRLQQKKRLKEKLQKLREDKESTSAETSNQDTDDIVKEIATMTGTNQEITEEDKEFVKKIYIQKDQKTLSDEEIQKRILEHFSGKRKMKNLIDEENISTRNKILERKDLIKKKRKEEEEQKQIQEQEEKRIQEENEEEQRKALSKAYRDNEMVKSSSLIRKHQADQARMAIAVEEGKSKVKDQIKEMKKRKQQQQIEYGDEP